ncbi:Helix-turn-helix domain protein [Grimontia celer]|uniref:Helix-turn-helix domain protein n=1 Tax=Grimontia celer TaxID=1796497 RepID=A0A128F248_9GAMM|nr:helix-turn-helix domain-containing protein [Grimontia celer]CZF80868.1 Helix-turn-helix domain protein [Grimontia celer]
MLDIDYQPAQGSVTLQNAYKVYVPPPPLSHWIHSFWQLDVPFGEHFYRSMPDNCVDWIINVGDIDDNVIVSPFLSSIEFPLSGPVSYFGVRFRVLANQGLIPHPIGEWDAVTPDTRSLELVSPSVFMEVFEGLQRTTSFSERCKYVGTALLREVKSPSVDRRLVSFIRYCLHNTESVIQLSDKQCAEFGVSARQLRRLTQLHLGMSPKSFSSVLRFQKTVKQLTQENQGASSWAAHYYDQSHFIREFKRFSGLTPQEFKRMSVLYNRQNRR